MKPKQKTRFTRCSRRLHRTSERVRKPVPWVPRSLLSEKPVAEKSKHQRRAEALAESILQQGHTYDMTGMLLEDVEAKTNIEMGSGHREKVFEELDAALYAATKPIFANTIQSLLQDEEDEE